MSNSEKILKSLSSLIENGILTSKDIKKEISTDLKFKKDKIINKLELVSREEFEVLKKIVQKQDLIIRKLIKAKKILKGKKILTCRPSFLLFLIECSHHESLLYLLQSQDLNLHLIGLNFYFYQV